MGFGLRNKSVKYFMSMIRQKLPITVSVAFLVAGVILLVADSLSAKAQDRMEFEFPNTGVDAFLNPNAGTEVIPEPEKTDEVELNIRQKFDAEKERMLTSLAMADVTHTLNVRADAGEEADKVGFLYRDCGGTILEQKNGWTKIQSGALTGWCSDEYLKFGDEAVKMADDVGIWLVTMNSEAVRVRKEPKADAEVIGLLSKSDYADFVEIIDNNWISIDFEGDLGYLDTAYIDIRFHIDSGETMEQVETRAKIEEQLRKAAEEEEAKKARTANRGKVPANADETKLLGALIYCEAGNQPYEGKVAVGAVVMNRVKSPAYPNTIYSVIYASGQFTPAMSGKVAAAYNKGVPDICLQAAAAAINGETTVGGATHFRRNDGREGYVLGAHVFW